MRIHGRHGKLYLDLVNTGTAQPVAFLTKWTIDSLTQKVDVTSMDDQNKTYVAGLPDAKGTIDGWYDDATPQTYTASQDGIARKFYLYPSTLVGSGGSVQYWYGNGLFDFSASGGEAEAVAVKGTWVAASAILKVG